MTLTQDMLDSFLDSTLLVLKQDNSRTTQLKADNLTSADLATKTFSEPDAGGQNFQIILSLPNRTEPIVIRNMATITLGRADRQRNAIPTVDLSNDNALKLGVSRLHAKILHSDACFYLKDLGSTNGTWVNNVRVPAYQMVPIQRGDQIRLGFLVIGVV